MASQGQSLGALGFSVPTQSLNAQAHCFPKKSIPGCQLSMVSLIGYSPRLSLGTCFLFLPMEWQATNPY